jgi:hypothetical protein
MVFEPPRLWWVGLFVALGLLATGGALNAVEAGMKDNYATDGCGFYWGGPRPVEDHPEDVDCRGQRLAIGIVDAFSRATFGPGVALSILIGVYLLGSVIAIALGSRNDTDRPDSDENADPPRKGGGDS